MTPSETNGTDLAFVDHLLFGAADLDRGIAAIEAALGVRPAIGGRHPAWGTRNALVSLGPRQYLEVFSPDPESDSRGRRPFDVDRLETPRLVAMCVASSDLEGFAERGRSVGVDVGSISAGGRVREDGTVLSWRLTDPLLAGDGGARPFAIDWGDTPHPGGQAPPAGRLAGLRLEHPDPDRIRRELEAFGTPLVVEPAERAGLVARIESERGSVELR